MPTSLSGIRAAALDLDGLMFDTEALYHRVAREMLAARGKTLTPEITAALIGRPWPAAGTAFRAMAGLAEPVEVLADEARARFAELVDSAVHPASGLFALLAHLEHHQVPCAVTTSSRRAYAERLLRRHGLLDRFAFVLTAEDVARAKPDPEIYIRAADRFGIVPVALLVLEDSPAGVAAAKAAGAFTVAVPHPHSPAGGLTAADRIVPRLDDPAVLDLIG